MASLACTCKTK